MSAGLLPCPICGTPLQNQTWARRAWVDCPSMHRLSVTHAEWESLTRTALINEIRDFLAGLPAIPDSAE